MLYKSFRIQNYKAIKDLEIELDEQRLTPIIGLNETGKSTILQAIFAFDYYNDSQYNSEFINLDYIRNRYNDKENPIIEAEIENIEKELSATLFIRTPKGLLLTPEGESAVHYAKIVLKEFDVIKTKISNGHLKTA